MAQKPNALSEPKSNHTYKRPSFLGAVSSSSAAGTKASSAQKALPYEETTFEDEWRCPCCSKANFLNRSSCRSCGTLKPRGATTASSEQAKVRTPPPRFLDDADNDVDDWLTPPSVEEPSAGRRVLPTARPGSDSHGRKGDWSCPSCLTLNFARRVTCFACTLPRPLVLPDGDSSCVPPVAEEPASTQDLEEAMYEAQLAAHWVCDDCGMVNGSSRAVCVGCAKAFSKVVQADQAAPLQRAVRTGATPTRRQLLESILAEEEEGDAARRQMSEGALYGSATDMFGDSLWGDDEVQSKVRTSRTTAPPQFDAVQQTNDDSKVDLDWACAACNYVNFRSRGTCRKCNTPKPQDVARKQRVLAEQAGIKFRGTLPTKARQSVAVHQGDDLFETGPSPMKEGAFTPPYTPDRCRFVPPEAPANCSRYFRAGNPRDPLFLFSYNASTKTDPKAVEGLRTVIAGRSVPSGLLGSIPLHRRFGDPTTGFFDVLLMSPQPQPSRLSLGDWQCACGVVNRFTRKACLGCRTRLLRAFPAPTAGANNNTESSCKGIMVVGLAEQMTLVRTQRLVRRGVLTRERACHLFSPEVLSFVEPAWFCGPCGMLVPPVESTWDRLKKDSHTPKEVCTHCSAQRIGKKGAHTWTLLFPELPRATKQLRDAAGGSATISSSLTPSPPSLVPAILVDGKDCTGHSLSDAALSEIKKSVSDTHSGDWICKKCAWYNFRDQNRCRRCSSGRASAVLSIVFDGAKVGDWVCGNCYRFNYHKLDTCFACYPPLKESQSLLPSEEPSMTRTAGTVGGAGMADVDAGAAFLLRREMDRIAPLHLLANQKGPSPSSALERKPLIGTRRQALVIIGEDLTSVVLKKHLPPPSHPDIDDSSVKLEVMNTVVASVYNSMGVCPSCSYRHYILDVLPGSKCKECHTELEVKLYPYMESAPPQPIDPASATDTSSTGSVKGPSYHIPTKSCKECGTVNHVDRDACRRCGLLLRGWICQADALEDDLLFRDGDEEDVSKDAAEGKCGHVNEHGAAYCTKCGTNRTDAPVPALEFYGRRSLGARLHGQTHLSSDWLSKQRSAPSPMTTAQTIANT